MKRFTNGQAVISVAPNGYTKAVNSQGVTVSLSNFVTSGAYNGTKAKTEACRAAAKEGIQALCNLTGLAWVETI